MKCAAEIVKTILKKLPKNDYPVLNTRLFVLIWLHLIFDKSLGSLRDLFFRLNHQGIAVDLSTFSKASKNRDRQSKNETHQPQELTKTFSTVFWDRFEDLCRFGLTI